MTIIQIMPEFGLGGAEIMCENLTYELKKLGHNVVVISMYNYHSAITDRLERAGVDIRYLNKKTGIDFSMIGKMKKIFKEVNADVVHTHLYCIQYAVPTAILAGVKHRVHTVHSVAQKENGRLARKLNKFFFKHCHTIPVALSKLVQDTVVDEYRLKRDFIPVILNGIDLSKCIVKENYDKGKNFIILHIGRFVEVKNHKRLLEAFRMFHEQHPDSKLRLIGDGELKEEAERYVRDNRLENSVEFMGLQSNVYPYLHDADVYTLTSDYEGIPMTLIEAMGTGLPIVATSVGGVLDMLDNDTAILTDVDSVQIAEAFEKYYSDDDLRKKHGKAALARAGEFSAAKMAEKYVEVYNTNEG